MINVIAVENLILRMKSLETRCRPLQAKSGRRLFVGGRRTGHSDNHGQWTLAMVGLGANHSVPPMG